MAAVVMAKRQGPSALGVVLIHKGSTLKWGQSMPRFEELSRSELCSAVLDIQKGLADLTKRLDSVGEENALLREENALLKDEIDSRIEGARNSGRRSGRRSSSRER